MCVVGETGADEVLVGDAGGLEDLGDLVGVEVELVLAGAPLDG